MAVESVSLKLPTFWTSSAPAWFAQAEAQFALRHVTQDDTKYYHVVSALDTNTATRALSILSAPPPHEKYQSIKTFLLSAYGLTDSERASTLLNLCGLGDAKPSELMDNMLSILGEHKPCFLFKELFLRQLPEHVRTPLAVSHTTDYRTLAQEADRLFLAGDTNRQPLNRPYTSQSYSREEQHVDAACWYHRTFGNNARKCNPACDQYRRKKRQGNAKAGQH